MPPHPAPATNPGIGPSGLSEEELAEYVEVARSLQGEEVVDAVGSEIQPRWNRVIAAYMDGDINLGQAATLLGLSRYELDERFRRLDVPRRVGTETVESVG